jgi:hypothetical protein
MLTLHFERVPPLASIQTYSAITLPRWSKLRYFWSCVMLAQESFGVTGRANAYVGSVGDVGAFGRLYEEVRLARVRRRVMPSETN